MITVDVQYFDNKGNPITTDNEISRIFVNSETEHAVIVSVETETKYPTPLLYHGHGLRFRTQAGNFADITIRNLSFPKSDAVITMAEAGRYNLYVVLFHDVRQDAQQIYGE